MKRQTIYRVKANFAPKKGIDQVRRPGKLSKCVDAIKAITGPEPATVRYIDAITGIEI